MTCRPQKTSLAARLAMIAGIFALAFAVSGFSFKAWSAPFPGATSMFVQPQKGLFWLRKGFVLPTEGTIWHVEALEGQANLEKEAQGLLTSVSYSSNVFLQARFTVNVENIKGASTVEAYSKRWVKEYYQYGFDLLKTKPIKINEEPAIVYDLKARQKTVQIRQVVLLKNKVAVTLTCTDDTKTFARSVIECDKMIQKFRWASAN